MAHPDDNLERQRELARALLPLARGTVEAVLSGVEMPKRLKAQVFSLASGTAASHRATAVLGALASAIVELESGLRDGSVVAGASQEALLTELVRLAYNRWQRDARASSRVRGHGADDAGGNPSLDRALRESAANPDRFRCESPEIRAQFRELFDQLVVQLTPKDLQVLKMFSEGYSDAEIAHVLGTHRTTISRKVDRLAELLRRLDSGPGMS